jgi:hypothetical protein
MHEAVLSPTPPEAVRRVVRLNACLSCELTDQALHSVVGHGPLRVDDAIGGNVWKEVVTRLHLHAAERHLEVVDPFMEVGVHVRGMDVLLIDIVCIAYTAGPKQNPASIGELLAQLFGRHTFEWPVLKFMLRFAARLADPALAVLEADREVRGVIRWPGKVPHYVSEP